MHIEWSSYATVDAPGSVVAFYRDRATTFHEEKVDGDATFAADADRKLTVSAADGTYPRCAKAPTPTERAVIVVSRAIR